MAVTDAVHHYESLTAPEKAQFRAAAGLPPPRGGGLTAVWITVCIIVGIVAMGGGFLAFLLIDNGKNAEAIIGLASAALGGLIGLLVPSPIEQQG